MDSNRKIALKTLDLMEAALRDPFSGIGKPEHLRHMGGNVRSRRITEADRLVYEVFDDRIEFLQDCFTAEGDGTAPRALI